MQKSGSQCKQGSKEEEDAPGMPPRTRTPRKDRNDDSPELTADDVGGEVALRKAQELVKNGKTKTEVREKFQDLAAAQQRLKDDREAIAARNQAAGVPGISGHAQSGPTAGLSGIVNMGADLRAAQGQTAAMNEAIKGFAPKPSAPLSQKDERDQRHQNRLDRKAAAEGKANGPPALSIGAGRSNSAGPGSRAGNGSAPGTGALNPRAAKPQPQVGGAPSSSSSAASSSSKDGPRPASPKSTNNKDHPLPEDMSDNEGDDELYFEASPTDDKSAQRRRRLRAEEAAREEKDKELAVRIAQAKAKQARQAEMQAEKAMQAVPKQSFDIRNALESKTEDYVTARRKAAEEEAAAATALEQLSAIRASSSKATGPTSMGDVEMEDADVPSRPGSPQRSANASPALSESSDIAMPDVVRATVDDMDELTRSITRRKGSDLRDMQTAATKIEWNPAGAEPRIDLVNGDTVCRDKMAHLEELQRIAFGTEDDQWQRRAAWVASQAHTRKSMGHSVAAATMMAVPHLGSPSLPAKYRPLKLKVCLAIQELRAGQETSKKSAIILAAALEGYGKAYMTPSETSEKPVGAQIKLSRDRLRDEVHEATMAGYVHPSFPRVLSRLAKRAGKHLSNKLKANGEKAAAAMPGRATATNPNPFFAVSPNSAHQQYAPQASPSRYERLPPAPLPVASDDKKRFLTDADMHDEATLKRAQNTYDTMYQIATQVQKASLQEWNPQQDPDSPMVILAANFRTQNSLVALKRLITPQTTKKFLTHVLYPNRVGETGVLQDKLEKLVERIRETGASVSLSGDSEHSKFLSLVNLKKHDEATKAMAASKTQYGVFAAAVQILHPAWSDLFFYGCERQKNPSLNAIAQYAAALGGFVDHTSPQHPTHTGIIRRFMVEEAEKFFRPMMVHLQYREHLPTGMLWHPEMLAKIPEASANPVARVLQAFTFALTKNAYFDTETQYLQGQEPDPKYTMTPTERLQVLEYGYSPIFTRRMATCAMEQQQRPMERLSDRVNEQWGMQAVPTPNTEAFHTQDDQGYLTMMAAISADMTAEERLSFMAKGPHKRSRQRTREDDAFPMFTDDQRTPNSMIFYEHHPYQQKYTLKGAVVDPSAPQHEAGCREARLQSPRYTHCREYAASILKIQVSWGSPHKGRKGLGKTGNEPQELGNEKGKKKGKGKGKGKKGGKAKGGKQPQHQGHVPDQQPPAPQAAPPAQAPDHAPEKGKGKGSDQTRNGVRRPFLNYQDRPGGKDLESSEFAKSKEQLVKPEWYAANKRCPLCLVPNDKCPNTTVPQQSMSYQQLKQECLNKCAIMQQSCTYYGVLDPFEVAPNYQHLCPVIESKFNKAKQKQEDRLIGAVDRVGRRAGLPKRSD